jgi:hypothetical protein
MSREKLGDVIAHPPNPAAIDHVDVGFLQPNEFFS